MLYSKNISMGPKKLPDRAREAPILPHIGSHVNFNTLSPIPARGPIKPVFTDTTVSFSSSVVDSSTAAATPRIKASEFTWLLKNFRWRFIASTFCSLGLSPYSRSRIGTKLERNPMACMDS